MSPLLLDHLWQSTAFAGAVALAAFALRRNSARARYWLWLAASVKFLIPFSLLSWAGAHVQLPPDAPSLHAVTIERISNYVTPVEMPAAAPLTRTALPWSFVLATVWLLGVSFLTVRWFVRWRTIQNDARRGERLPLRFPVPVLSSRSGIEPGVFGVFRPVLLLPGGLADRLTNEQLNAVLAHESRHIRCCDNLTAAVHMYVETLFWFHPLVWWIGARLMDEREKDCDEAVLRQGSRPRDYAQGIVSVCGAYVDSPLSCAAGISGSDLKKRIRGIMTWRPSLPLTAGRKMLLTVSAVAILSIPVVIGIVRAQSLPLAPQYGYEAVSIHPSPRGQPDEAFLPGPMGGMRTLNTPVLLLLSYAYDVPDYRFVNAPAWLSSARYDIVLTPDKPDIVPGRDTPAKDQLGSIARNQQRLRAVLRDRFKLVLRIETRELPLYVLTQAKGGSKLHAVAGDKPATLRGSGKGGIKASHAPLKFLTDRLSRELERPVNDETGLGGLYDFELNWHHEVRHGFGAPDGQSNPTDGESIFTALPEQLGLRLESRKGPVQVYVIERIERPSDN